VDAIHTCSFLSISCFSKVERDSRVSPLDSDDPAFDDSRLVTGAEFKDDGTREEAADRAVAPFAIEDEGGVGEAERGRLEVGDARTVAILLLFCDA
jgi:hypothetical protein